MNNTLLKWNIKLCRINNCGVENSVNYSRFTQLKNKIYKYLKIQAQMYLRPFKI